MDLKQEVLSMVNGLSNVDPSRGSTNLTSMIHAIQPMLIYEAILRPTSDLVSVTCFGSFKDQSRYGRSNLKIFQ